MINKELTEEVELGGESLAAYKKSQGCEANPSSQSEITALIAAFADYMVGADYSPLTVESYRDSLAVFEKYLKEMGVMEPLTPKALAGYQTWLYARTSRFGKPLTVASQICMLNALRMLLRFLYRTDRILKDLSPLLRLPKAPENLPANLVTAQQARKLLAQPDTATVIGFRDRTIMEVIYATGLRVRELLALKVVDINLVDGAMWIRHGKGRKDRQLPLGKTAMKYLAEYIKNVRPILARGRKVEELFLNSFGKPIGMSGLCSKIHVYAKRADVKPAPGSKPITVHTFRHTLATEMLKHGADLRHIQDMMGHGQLRTTQRYLHLVKSELRKVQEKCHPREQAGLPPAAMKYRGFNQLPEDRK